MGLGTCGSILYSCHFSRSFRSGCWNGKRTDLLSKLAKRVFPLFASYEIRHGFPLYPFARLLLFFQVRDPVRTDRFERMMQIKADNLGGTFSRK
jgi:hypothetical protein